ncbi:MAG: hypothetical protein P8Y63_11510 [Deltaproteobacteria bacterium]
MDKITVKRLLHGPNNVGKTSLIAVLQFLYIDDQRNMHFSREMAETRKYYFPDQNSYLLFECLTPRGYQVVGVQGQGPIRGYEFQRFSYQGQYDQDDFLDPERRIRSPEEIRTRLAAREFRLLEPRHLRAALTGLGDNKGVNLGLVPIRHRDQYERFRSAFGNLLRLAHLRQEELKQFLLEIFQGEFQQRAIDLEVGYSSQYRKVCREAEAVGELRAIIEDVRLVLELAGKRDGLRRLLPGIWAEIRSSFARTENEILHDQQQIKDDFARLSKELDCIEKDEIGNQEARDEVLKDLGRIKGALAQHRQEEEEFRNFLPDFEEARLQNLETELEGLSASLGLATDVSVEQVRSQVLKMEKLLAGLQRQREQFSRNVASKLLPMLSDADSENIFRLINPEILGLVHGKEGLEVKDEEKLAAALLRFTNRIREGVYEDDLVRVLLDSLSRPDLAVFHDAQTLARHIAEQEDALKRERRLLAAAENTQQIRRKKELLQKERDLLYDRLSRFRGYQERLPQIQAQAKEESVLEERQKQLDVKLKELAGQRSALIEKKRSLDETRRDLESQKEKLITRIQKLGSPDPLWPVEPFASEDLEMDRLLEIYEQKYREHDEVARRFAEEFRRIELRTYGKYLGEDEAATLANLQAEVEALAEKEKAVQELWKSLAAGLQSAFKGLDRDLQTLNMRLDELNRRLGRVSISNLERLRLLLREHPEWTRRIKTVAEFEAIPLFADSGAVTEAQNQLGELLNRYRRVELADLFDLQFEVTSIDGQTRRYQHLDSIESNGTTITIKVLINLMLLRGLLDDKKEVTVPFYLDEASSLDRENLIAIVREARKMGFVAVLASPEAMDAADALFFLREINGRVVLDPKISVVRIERNAGDGC